jgi:large subunit ribosomal protein L25
MVPGIVYGAHKDPVMIAVPHNDLVRHLEHEAFYSHVLDLTLSGSTEKVVLKDLQRHPAKPFVTHVDFQRVSAEEKIRMHVPLHFLNEAGCPGVKTGGTVTHNITEVEITCLPKDLPEYIGVDMGAVQMGESVHLGQVVMPDGVELVRTLDLDAPVVSIHGTRGGAEEGEQEEEAPSGE